MNYELAKQLKDAGFPLDSGAGHSEFITKDIPMGQAYWLYFPTLEELIEACGDETIQLRYYSSRISNTPSIRRCVAKIKDTLGIGWSLEEAVARLWLALKRK